MPKSFFRRYTASDVNTIIGEHFISAGRLIDFKNSFANSPKTFSWKTQPEPDSKEEIPFATVKSTSEEEPQWSAIFPTFATSNAHFGTSPLLGTSLSKLSESSKNLLKNQNQILIPLDIRSREHIVLLQIIPGKNGQPATCTLLDSSAIGLFYDIPPEVEAPIKAIFGDDTIFKKTILFQQWEDVNCGVNVCCNAMDLMDDPDTWLSRWPTLCIDERLRCEDLLEKAIFNNKIDQKNYYDPNHILPAPSSYEKITPNYLTGFYQRNRTIIKTVVFLAILVIVLCFIPGVGPFLSGLAGAIGLTGLTALQAGAIGAGILLSGGMIASFFHEVFHGISYLMKHEKNTTHEIPTIPDRLENQYQKEDNLEPDNKKQEDVNPNNFEIPKIIDECEFDSLFKSDTTGNSPTSTSSQQEINNKSSSPTNSESPPL